MKIRFNFILQPKVVCPGKLLTCPLKRFPFTIRTSNETVIIPKIVLLKPHIFYDLDRQPSKIRNLQTINSSPYEKFRKILKRLFLEPIQNGSVLSHHVTKTKVFVCFDSFVIALLMKAIFRIVDFHDTHLNDIWLFQNRIPYII